MEIILPALLGILSLLILVFYSRLRNPIFKLIPAPMWVVFLAIGLNYYYDLVSSHEYPIGSNLLISLPDNIWSDLPTPDFGIALTLPFLSTVFSITLISSIESLLSIKAVDKLDPQKRRSNVNKDLRALGIATALSGMVGGLNVVTVIARSQLMSIMVVQIVLPTCHIL